jgi:uncharacterized protein (DUF1330 family)
MAAYVIAEIDVKDPEIYKAYTTLTPASVARHGGRFIVRGGPAAALEGAPPKRVVVLEFADAEAARRWYDSPQYREARAIREKAAVSRLFLIEGAPPA